jgi:HlyD family secretion protein
VAWTLYDKQLVPGPDQCAGARAASSKARAGVDAVSPGQGQDFKVELQMIQIDQVCAKRGRSPISGQTLELTGRKVATEDQLSVSTFAPLAGTVHQLSMHTVGGVIGPAS